MRKTARLCGWRGTVRKNEKDPQVLPAGQKCGGEPPGRLGRRKAYLAALEKALSYGLYASLARSLYISPILVTSPTKPS